MGSLPMPPQIGGPTGGTNQPNQGLGYMSSQVLPYKPPLGPDIINGINAFMQQFRQQQDQEKQRRMSEFQTDSQMLQAGVPVDLKKMARNAKKAGLNLDFESTAATPGMPATQVPGSPGMPGSGGTLSGQPATPGQAAIDPRMIPGIPGTPAQPAPQQSGFAKFAQAMGLQQPQINPNSPGMQWLQSVQRGAQQNQQAAAMAAQTERMKQALYQAAIGGNPQAQTLMAHVKDAQGKSLWDRLPGEDAMSWGRQIGKSDADVNQALWDQQFGEKDAIKTKAELAKSLLPSYGNRLDQAMAAVNTVFSGGKLTPNQLPGKTPAEQKDIFETAYKVHEMYPTAPLELPKTYALAFYAGDKDVQQKVLDMLNSSVTDPNGKSRPRYMTSGQADWQKHLDTNQEEEKRLGQELTLHRERMDLDRTKMQDEASHGAISNWMDLKKSGITGDELAAAKEAIMEKLDRGGIKGVNLDNIPGVFWGSSKEFRIKPSTMQKLRDAAAKGDVQGVKDGWDELTNPYTAGLSDEEKAKYKGGAAASIQGLLTGSKVPMAAWSQ